MPASTYPHYQVVINNPTDLESEWLAHSSFEFAMTQRIKISYIRYQLEIGANEGTPHFQIYIQLSHPMTPRAFTDKLEGTLGRRPAVTVLNGSSDDNLAYVSKDDTRAPGHTWHEWGQVRDIPARAPSRQGARVDLEAVREAIESGASLPELQEKFFSEFCKYDRFLTRYHLEWNQRQVKSNLHSQMSTVSLRPWQSTLVDTVSSAADSRKVHWWWDPEGNKGKTFVARYLLSLDGWILCQMMKKSDLLHLITKSIANAKGVIFDLTRSSEDGSVKVVYEVCEMLKSEFLCSGKYDSVGMMTPPVHVIVFANYEPDRTAWSPDRYDVHRIV
jgi:hypothetical protein